jgi:uncharacterized protein
MMKRNLRYGLLGVGVAAGMTLGAGPVAADTNLTFFTGPSGGSWVPIGAAMKVIWEDAIPGLAIENRPGAGLINMRAIEQGMAEIGFGNLISTVDALRGEGEGIEEPYTQLCHAASLYPQVTHVIVRADAGVESFDDLTGLRVATLPPGNTTQVVAQKMFELAGHDFDGVNITYANTSDQANMYRDGQIDASILITTAPAGAIMDMANARNIKLVDIDDELFAKIQDWNPGFSRYVVSKETYPGLEEDAQAIAFPAHLLVSCDLPDDLVYEMVRSLNEGLSDLAAVNAVFRDVDVSDLGAEVPVPWHPGAQRFFEEQGVL